MYKGTTLTQYVISEMQKQDRPVSGDFTGLINDIATACKKISDAVNQGDLIGVLGAAETENVQGEVQKKLDIITNDIFIESTEYAGHVAGMASEEVEEVYQIPEKFQRGKYLLTFDPLDGSSNVDVNISVGTIFSILRAPQGPDAQPTEQDFFQKGTEQVAAGYALYGPSTQMVITLGNGVHVFTLDRKIGEFILTGENLQIPEDTSEFAINAANERYWMAPISEYVKDCKAGKEGPRGRNFNMRWVASMVAEVHRILNRGGVFMYPVDERIVEQGGKLRLLYEANPMSFLIEQAGGASSTGTGRIMEVEPHKLHQRVPVILGSKNEVKVVEEYHAKHG